MKHLMGKGSGAAVHHQESGMISVLQGLLRNQMFRQVIVIIFYGKHVFCVLCFVFDPLGPSLLVL